MKNLTTYLFVIFMAMFWVFRIIVAFCYNLGVEFAVQPTDLNFEIILLFLTFVAMILVIKRSTLGGIIYLIGNGLYFGMGIFNAATAESTVINYAELLVDFIRNITSDTYNVWLTFRQKQEGTPSRQENGLVL